MGVTRSTWWWVGVLALLAGAVRAQEPAGGAVGQTDNPRMPAQVPTPLLNERWPDVPQMLDGIEPWRQLRASLEDTGISLGLSATQVFQVSNGGQSRSTAESYTISVDAELTLDFGRLAGLKGLSFYLFMDNGFGHSPKSAVGSWSAPNWDVVDTYGVTVAEYWFQYLFEVGDLTVRQRLGLIDYSRTFDVNRYAWSEVHDFLNSFLNNVPYLHVTNTIFDTGLGYELKLSYRFSDALTAYAASGIYSANQTYGTWGFNEAFGPSGPRADGRLGVDGPDCLWLGEMGALVELDGPNGPMPGGYRVGLLYTSQETLNTKFNTLGVLPEKYQAGYGAVYMNFDQMVYREKAESRQEGLGVFFRFGAGSHDRAIPVLGWPMASFWSFGFAYTGLIPTRDQDTLAFGYALAARSSQAFGPNGQAFQQGRDEQVFEAHYRIQVFDWLAITPDVQYIVHPGTNLDVPSAVVAGLRFVMVF